MSNIHIMCCPRTTTADCRSVVTAVKNNTKAQSATTPATTQR